MIPYSRVLAAVCLVAAVVSGLAAAMTSLRFPAIVIAVGALLLGATAISRANETAHAMRGYIHARVTAHMWNQTPSPRGTTLTVERIFAISAGLHVWLRDPTEGAVYRIKIAQPRDITVGEMQSTIRNAKYISCNRRRLERSEHSPAFVVEKI